jgi:hypothetical protein
MGHSNTPETLNTGHGDCHLDNMVSMTISKRELRHGKGAAILNAIAGCVHQMNRTAGEEGFLAIGFPNMGFALAKGAILRGFEGFAGEIQIYGSDRAVQKLLQTRQLETLVRKEAISLLFGTITADLAGVGMVFFRDQRRDKDSAAYRERIIRRCARNGRPAPTWSEAPKTCVQEARNDIMGFFMPKRAFRIYVRPKAAYLSAKIVQVNTYGLSSAGHEAVLPVAKNALLT